MLKVGLTGGIGSGKSEVAKRLAALGAVVVDADVIARQVVEPGTPGLAEVVAEFGEGVLRSDGSLDRDALGRIVFADAECRRRLNAIVHPLVGEQTRRAYDAVPPDSVVVHDVPLLVENGLAPAYDVVVVVDAPEAVRLERLTHRRGMAESDARQRIASQAGDEERRSVADVVIDNAGSLKDLDPQVARLWQALTERGR
ncbi:MAG: dephospho-CoA kinase [Actinomycetota bacterium]|nr:dephospho-CoA kinase [Actinomycetota bacterium]